MTSKLLSQAIGLSGTTGNSTNITVSSNGSLQLAANGGTDIFISANDNIGFGNTTPADKLSIQGSLYTSSNTVTIGTAAYFTSNGAIGFGISPYVATRLVANGTIRTVSVANSSLRSDWFVNQVSNGVNWNAYNDASSVYINSVFSSNNFSFQVGNTASITSMFLDANGNIGVSATPSAWHPSAYKAIQIGRSAAFYGHAGVDATYVGSNMYDDGAWKYINSSANSSLFQQYQGAHIWYQAGSGTAGANISFTQAMTLAANGNLGIGNTAPASKLVVNGPALIEKLAIDQYHIGIGEAGSGNRVAYIDFNSDDTYTDYALRIIRWNNGPNSQSTIEHRGTGAFNIYATEDAPIAMFTNSTERMRIDGSGNVTGRLARYNFVNTGGTAGYIYLGRWSSAGQDGTKLKMTITSAAGYNADINQNQVTEVYFKTSNGSSYRNGSTGNFYADGMMWKKGPNTSTPTSIRVVNVDSTTYDFYGYFGQFTGDYSFYQVSVSSGIWTNNGTFYGTSSPSGNYIDLIVNYVATLNNDSLLQNANGIKFLATQVSSTDANVLDDYEEGYWTPILRNSAGTESVTFGNTDGRYVKIGSQVFLMINSYSKTVTALSATTHIHLAGLPFQSSSSIYALFLGNYPAKPVTILDGGASTMFPLYVPADAVNYNAFTRNEWGGASVITLRGQFSYIAS